MCAKSPHKGSPPAAKHGLYAMKATVKALGSRVIDRRTMVGKELARWRAELMADLGGEAFVTTQQAVLVELAVRSKLLVDAVDAWLLVQPSLVDRRRRALLPVVRERQQLADGLTRCMTALGVERRKLRSILTEYLEKYDPSGVRTPRNGAGCRHREGGGMTTVLGAAALDGLGGGDSITAQSGVGAYQAWPACARSLAARRHHPTGPLHGGPRGYVPSLERFWSRSGDSWLTAGGSGSSSRRSHGPLRPRPVRSQSQDPPPGTPYSPLSVSLVP
jgi:hypothetical protein